MKDVRQVYAVPAVRHVCPPTIPGHRRLRRTVLAVPVAFIALAAMFPAAGTARVPDMPPPLEVALFKVAKYAGATDYSGLVETQNGPVAVFAYGGAPAVFASGKLEILDVWTYWTGSWTKQATIHLGGGSVFPAAAQQRAGYEVVSDPNLPIDITFPVSSGSYQSIGLIAYEAGTWREVPFEAPSHSTFSVYPGGPAHVNGAFIESTEPDSTGAAVKVNWRYNPDKHEFSTLAGSLAATPPPLQGSAMGYDSATGQLVLFGQPRQPLGGPLIGETWTWNGATWERQAAPGPTGESQVVVYDARTSQLVMIQPTPNASGNLSNTWLWTGSAWKEPVNASGPPYYSDVAAYDAATGEVVLLVAGGGFLAGNGSPPPAPQTWLWNGSAWRHAHPAHSPPLSPAEPMAYDPVSRRVILQGTDGVGANGFSPLHDETWAYDGSDWSALQVAHPPPDTPGAVMALDESSNQLWLLDAQGYLDAQCGTGVGTVSDIYAWNGSDWSSEIPSEKLVARQYAAMASDGATGQLLLFGGCELRSGGQSAFSNETQVVDGPQPSQIAQPAPESGPKNGCDGILDTGIGVSAEPAWVKGYNDALKKNGGLFSGSRGIAIPFGAVSRQTGLALTWKPEFDPGEAKVCALGVLGAVRDAPWTAPSNDLSLSLETQASSMLGLYTYSASTTSWTSAPQAPAGERLSTTWLPQFHVLGGPRLTISKEPLSATFNLAELELASVKTKFTLVQKENALFDAELGPTLSLVLEVEKKRLLDEAAEKLKEIDSSGNPTQEEIQTAEQEVGQEVADATAAEAESFETSYLSTTVTSGEATTQVKAIIDSVSRSIADELATELTNLAPNSADLAELGGQGITPAELSAQDAELLGGAAEGDAVIGGKLACVAIAGGPEDIFGDIFCAVI
jgi:hypothetical protein